MPELYKNITDKEIYPNGLLPNGIIECKGCGKECVDASKDGDEMCCECLQEIEEARLELESQRNENVILCELYKAMDERAKIERN